MVSKNKPLKIWDRTIINTPQGRVEGIAPVIISASRATDIPAFYADWFMHRLRAGYVKWINPFNGKSVYVSFEKLRAIVFWTKNAEQMIEHLPELDEKGINYYFTYTLNDYANEKLEMYVPPLQLRIETFKRLSDIIGKGRIIWRFDPLILTERITVDVLLDKIYGIGKQIHSFTEKLVISFIDINLYKKVKNNLLAAEFINCREFSNEDIIKIARGLKEMNDEWKLQIATCAEAVDLSEYGIKHNKCIDDEIMIRQFKHDKVLMDFIGYTFDERNRKGRKQFKDRGQRKHCGCIPSKDIGQYDTCIHGCIYCYANTSLDKAFSNYLKFKKNNKFCDQIICD